jgi:succinate dehydrogenase flavin-adding protein (antitoxin of CptAB toxin-antitoxin module)
MDSYQKNKLHWKCRRGLLELDLVFQKFIPGVEEKDLTALNEILELPDNDLWDIVIGRSDRFPPHLNEIVARLRAA